jgi:pseudaminic acid synthase
MKKQPITINNVTLGAHTYIIAELSANHNQDIALAKAMVKAAQDAGADAVKLQTYTPDTMTLNIDAPLFKAGDIWNDENLYQLYERAYMPWEWQRELATYAKALGITLFSSPFDTTAVDFLETLDVPAYKIASFEITDIPLIRYSAAKMKPMIISTGIADEEDIRLAVEACHAVGNDQIILLKCTSAYPAPLDAMHLNTIPDMRDRFGVMVGFSDHTVGIEAPIAAVALGAKVIEKHFTIDKNLDTPDRDFSLDPTEFKAMVDGVRKVEQLLGHVDYTPKSHKYARSLFVTLNIQKGERFSAQNIRSIRPGDGLHPRFYDGVLGKEATQDIARGTPLSIEMVERMGDVIALAKQAGEAIMNIYTNETIDVTIKSDNSPVTQADLLAHEIISEGLERIAPYPVVSEEDHVAYEERQHYERFWLVDPLDGTKDFIAKNGEFTINIALIEDKQSILGVIYIPTQQTIYYAQKGQGAFCNDHAIHVDQTKRMIAGISNFHNTDETLAYLKKHNITQTKKIGSAIKFCALAEGSIDIYPRYNGTSEWDTAAGQIIVEEAGGTMIDLETNKPMRYNKKSLRNNFFIASK